MIAVWETVPYRRAGAEEEEEADEGPETTRLVLVLRPLVFGRR